MTDLGNRQIMAKNLQRLIEYSGKTRQEICDDLDIPYSTFSEWMNAKKYPRIDKIEKMANYFHVKKSELVEEQPTDDRPHYIIDPDAEKMIVDMYENPDLRVVFDCARKVKPEDLEQVAKLIKTFIPEDDDDHIC